MSDPDGGCPHLSRNDTRCAHRFRLPQLDQLFEVCCDRFLSCTVYHHLTREAEASDAPTASTGLAPSIPLQLTINGALEHVRPTGS